MHIADKTVLLTGANRGVGEALVEEALNRGAKRVFAGTRVALTNTDPREHYPSCQSTKSDGRFTVPLVRWRHTCAYGSSPASRRLCGRRHPHQRNCGRMAWLCFKCLLAQQ